VFDAQTSVELCELLIYKLSAIIGDDSMWDTISAYNIIPDELLNLLGCDSGQWFDFYPFGEIIDGYYKEFHLALTGGEGVEDIHSSFSKGPRG